MDTTRADVVDAETTPALWARAARGASFTAAFAHAPTTLSSHASVFTGLDPHGHSVPRNGYAIPVELPMLQERLAAAGYQTIGVAGASALARPMGVDRGFSIWDERLTHKHEVRYEARASDVTDRALQHLTERTPGAPIFLFVHYFDAHAPYEAPELYATRWHDAAYTGSFDGSRRAMQDIAEAARRGAVEPGALAELRARYRGEVAYVDAQVDRLLSKLDNPLVITFGDHGEALGDLPDHPFGHGPDIDPIAVRVPLVVSGPGVPAAVIDAPVALSNVGATVLGLAGIAGGLGNGRDLAAMWRDEKQRGDTIFLEATQPRKAERTDGWNNLAMERGVVDASQMFILHPVLDQAPSVVRWREAPIDIPGVPDEQFEVQARGLLDAWDAAAPPWRAETDDEAMAGALRALGYAE
jgi:arylsulfatase A-like enzyme